MTIDLTGILAHGDRPANYTVTLYAQSLGADRRVKLAELRGIIGSAPTVPVSLEPEGLTPGTYRVEAVITSDETKESAEPFGAFKECGLIHVT